MHARTHARTNMHMHTHTVIVYFKHVCLFTAESTVKAVDMFKHDMI